MSATPAGLALCIGIDTADGKRVCAEANALALSGVADRQGFLVTTLLLGPAASRAAVLFHIHAAAAACRAGDLFVLTFSGHGGRKSTICSDGRVGLRAVWTLCDGSLTDHEMRAALAQFRAGVRVLVIADSCNGGIPAADADASAALPIAASVLVLAACRSDQLADGNGLPGHFTTVLLNAWREGQFTGTYRSFYEEVRAGMPAYQQPELHCLGRADQDFEAQRPFTI